MESVYFNLLPHKCLLNWSPSLKKKECLEIEDHGDGVVGFPIGDLNSSTTTEFNTKHNFIVNSNTYWVDARSRSDKKFGPDNPWPPKFCDIPEVGVIGQHYYDTIHREGNHTA